MLGSFGVMMFVGFMLLSTFFCIVSSNWFGVWVGLELNLISFIYFLGVGGGLGYLGFKKESLLVYFMVQAVGSLLMLFFVMGMFLSLGMGNFYFSSVFNSILFGCIVVKLGIGPFFIWFPYVMDQLSWLGGVFLMTWQKLAPFILCIYFLDLFFVYLFFIMSSSVIGSFGGFNEVIMKKLLGYSSISHGGWMLGLLLHESFMFYFYYVIYALLVLVVVGLVYVKDIMSLNEMLLGGSGVIGSWWLFSMMSLGGLPPFLGFFMKWSAIICLLSLSITLVLVMVFLALVSLFYYLRVVYSFLLMSHWIVSNESVEMLFGMSLGLFMSLGGVIFLPFLSFM